MAKKKTAIEYEPSQYQKAIFDYIQHEKGNLVVEAAAGSGRTPGPRKPGDGRSQYGLVPASAGSAGLEPLHDSWLFPG